MPPDAHDGHGVVSAHGHLAVLADNSQTDRAEPGVSRSMVVSHERVADRYFLLRLHAPQIARTSRPGQFVMLTVARDGEPGPVLPRPMAVFARRPEQGHVDVMYGVVGSGTRALSSFAVGERLAIVGPLGRGFDLAADTGRILLLGRGIGTCSLTDLAAEAVARGVDTVVVNSARHAGALIATGAYRDAGVNRLHQVTDDDGSSDPASLGQRLVDELDADPPRQVYVCGSNRLIRLATELGDRWGAQTQVSLEAHMACGLGYCHGCSSGQRTDGREAPLICQDGPVFEWASGESRPA